MNDTSPVFTDSTQATHWTCPQAPHRGATHHMTYPSNTCAYCKVSRPDLVARHEEILKIAGYGFEAEMADAVESIIVHAKDGALVGVAWMDESGQWKLGAPRTGRTVNVRSKERAERLLAKYAKFYRVNRRHGI